MRYYVNYVNNGQGRVCSFDTEKEAKHFAKLVNGTITKDW